MHGKNSSYVADSTNDQATVSQTENSGLVAGLMALKIGLFVGGTMAAMLSPGVREAVIASWLMRGAGGALLTYDIHRTFSSPDFYHDVSAEGQTDYYTKDEWKCYKKDTIDTISWAEAHSAFDWRFDTTKDDVFAIKITAKVTFGRYVGSGWIRLHTDSTSIVISIADYWN